MTIELPFPAKILWPNGRGHHMKKHRLFQDHKRWAYLAAYSVLPGCFKPTPDARFRLLITVHPKTRNAIDKDNASAAMKAYQDGIAKAMKVDDSRFELPDLQFGEPVKGGSVVVSIMEAK